MGRTVLTLGSFDGLHVGHLELLETCRQLAGAGGRVVVALNPDAFIEAYKGRPPLVPYRERAELLTACRLVDAVLCNAGGADSGPAIAVANPDFIAVGDDWLDQGQDERRYLAQLGVTREWLDERGVSIEYVSRTRGVSSSGRRAASLAEIASNAATYRSEVLGISEARP